MTTAPRYNSAAETLTIIAAVLPSTDRRRIEFEATSTGDQEAFIAQATAEIDANLWNGTDAVAGQQTRFPRRADRGTTQPVESGDDGITYLDPDPSPPANPYTAYIPAGVRIACALQSAHNAEQAAGLSMNRQIAEAANAGVTGQSGAGMSQSVDLRRANHPWSALCLDAQRHLSRYRRSGGMVS